MGAREAGIAVAGTIIGFGVGYYLLEYVFRDTAGKIIEDYTVDKDKAKMVSRWWKLFFGGTPDPEGLSYYVDYATNLENRGYNDAHVALWTGIAILQGGAYNQPPKYVTFPEPP